METLAGYLTAVLKPRFEEDAVDRLNYQYTGWLLLAFSITLSAKQYVGEPLQCWQPAQFTDFWTQYVHDYCLVENTYYLPWERNIPDTAEERDERMLSYYQWVPFILAIMAVLFIVPHFVWRSLNFLSGLPVRALIGMAKEAGGMEPGTGRQDAVGQLSAHIHDSVEIQGALSSAGNPLSWFLSCGKRTGVYVCLLYVLTKLLFLGNLALQYHILNFFLGPDHHLWGIDVLRDLVQGRDWTDNGQFPRVTLCDFQVRVLGQIQKFTVQCVLMINMFNEKIFLFLWWWFLLVGILTIYSLVRWLFMAFLPAAQESFIRRMLNTHGLPRDRNSAKVSSFAKRMLKPDGILVLRLMSTNAGELITSQVVRAMWLQYVDNHDHPPPNDLFASTHKTPLVSAPPLDTVDSSKPTHV